MWRDDGSYRLDYMASQEAYLSLEAFGWLSIALVIFALWRPARTIIGSTIFGERTYH